MGKIKGWKKDINLKDTWRNEEYNVGIEVVYLKQMGYIVNKIVGSRRVPISRFYKDKGSVLKIKTNYMRANPNG